MYYVDLHDYYFIYIIIVQCTIVETRKALHKQEEIEQTIKPLFKPPNRLWLQWLPQGSPYRTLQNLTPGKVKIIMTLLFCFDMLS